MTVKLLGAGCQKCKVLEQRLLALKAVHNLSFERIKITDIDEILSYGIMMTPGLVISGTLKSTGTVPKDSVFLDWLQDQAT